MKKIHQLFAAVVLTLLLSISAFAVEGIIHTLKTDLPPSPSSITTDNEAEAEGIITTGSTANDSVTEIALSLLPSVLALF